MNAKQTFMSFLRENLEPLLRESGFKGSGANFRRISGEVIHCFNIQGNKYGKSCAINLGIHLGFLPVRHTGECHDASYIKEIDCRFRRRLAPTDANDAWWEYDGPLFDPLKNARNLVITYLERGEPFFMRYRDVEQFSELASPDDLVANAFDHELLGYSVPGAALTMARIHSHLNNQELAKRFAKIGLDHAGANNDLKANLLSVMGTTNQDIEP